jgi:UDP-4-amino-4-deoxy-L-arabinose-oxoglutarate aminotransferase
MSQPHLPFSRPSISEAAIAEVVEVLRSGWITSGAKVQAFEREFAALVGARHAIAVSSGTAGLDLVVAALDLQDGDEVILPSINWVSGPNVVELHGGRAVFCDVLGDSLQIDPAAAARLITPRTRAIMPVHFAGMPCDLARLRALASAHRLVLIEDAAHAAGASWNQEMIGGSGALAVFSFHPTKNLTTGEGGMVCCADERFAERIRLGRFHGIRKDAWSHFGRSGRDRYQVLDPGRKYNLTDIQAAIGIHQLRELGAANAERARLAGRYRALLAGHPVARLLAPAPPDTVHAWHILVVLLELERLRGGRDALVAGLEARGIGTGLHFPPVHTQRYYRERYPQVHLPVSEAVGERLLTLPLFPGMGDAGVERVVAALDELARELAP